MASSDPALPLPMFQNMPNVRDHDASVYLRLQGDALSVGGYESNPIFWEEVSAARRFSGGNKAGFQGSHLGGVHGPLILQAPTSGGWWGKQGEHLPFGAVRGTDMQCRGNRRARSPCAHPSILNSDFRFVWVVQENPKIPEIQCNLCFSSPRLPEMRWSHTISHPLFRALILVSPL